ncbi:MULTISPECIES: flagellar export protein FliJ [Corallincola]|uniref:Flagellar FliJ protein n=3 Tax=Corallincola TaxID=1775176 RepID=A0A368N257_9GAMM|nr:MULTISPECIES: flagellar export protein FliJ [Corallincola]RCU44568.1 flagellar export protein FliJ [Corallincola holothuriorum]TAA40313.1 flagellar export protein FliJ [Corallincola spongiicola]TCI05380.1 flagellar export protein FliJ [Corallincola luteus]
MAKIEQLLLVAKLAEEEEQQAARLLKQAADRVMAEEQQETLLQQYRFDYLHQLRSRGNGGMGSAVYIQFQQFLERLDGVIVGQQQKISEARRAQIERKAQWDRSRQKRNAIDLLIEKSKAAKALKESRLEQKQADEFSSQQLVRRLMSARNS